MGAASEALPRAVRSLSRYKVREDCAGVDSTFDDDHDDVSAVRDWISVGEGSQMRRRQKGSD